MVIHKHGDSEVRRYVLAALKAMLCVIFRTYRLRHKIAYDNHTEHIESSH